MAKYKVHLQQYVEMVTTIEVFAVNQNEAVTLAKEKASQAEWKQGDDAYSVACYAVMDANDNIIWER